MDGLLDHFPHRGLDSALARLIAHWIPPPVGVVKVNVDGSYMDNTSCIGAGDIMRDHTCMLMDCGFLLL